MTLIERVLLGLAGFYGASGVALAAASAHLAPGSSLGSASLIALVHAPAMLAALAARHDGLLDARLGLLGLGGFGLGVALFSGDLTMRTFLGYPLFAMAAPSGGVLLIGGWLVLAAAGLVKQK